MDERSQKLIAGAMAITLSLVYLFLLVSCIWKYAVTGDITNCTTELVLIILIPAAIGWFARKDESLLIPRMFPTGQELPADQSPPAKKRRKKYYFLNAIGLAAVFLIFSILDALFIQKEWEYFVFSPNWSKTTNIFFTYASEFFLGVIIFFAIGFIWSEWNIRRYHRKLKELED